MNEAQERNLNSMIEFDKYELALAKKSVQFYKLKRNEEKLGSADYKVYVEFISILIRYIDTLEFRISKNERIKKQGER